MSMLLCEIWITHLEIKRQSDDEPTEEIGQDHSEMCHFTTISLHDGWCEEASQELGDTHD